MLANLIWFQALINNALWRLWKATDRTKVKGFLTLIQFKAHLLLVVE